MVYEVIIDISSSKTDKIYDYSADFEIPCGSRVLVPFGKRKIQGFVIGKKEESSYQTKNVIKIMDDKPLISMEMLSLAKFLSKERNLRLIDILRLCIPSKIRGGKIGELKKAFITLKDEKLIEKIPKRATAQRAIAELLKEKGEYESVLNKMFSPQSVKSLIEKGIAEREYIRQLRTPYKNIEGKKTSLTLNTAQKNAIEKIMESEGEYLIHGVTGSGKTEIYMRVIEEDLKRGRTAIMLVPEISLTPQMLSLFRARFGDMVGLLHSGLSDGERFDEWQRLFYGEAKVVLGARSAIFAPLTNLGVIIIDEEHDTSYISESNPRYFTHEIARFRRQYNNARLIFGSATPSLETYKRAKEGEYKLITLKDRVNQRSLPEMQIVDMRKEIRQGNMSIFSNALLKELNETISQGNQAMLFINRRGFASFIRCRKCGYIPKCTDCEVSLTFHKDDNRLKCHYCGKQFYNIDECPKCGFKHLKEGRIGTQKVVEELQKLFPDIQIARMDNDTVKGKNSHMDILRSFAQGKAQVLVGTQMIVKGHDFKDVTLVGILDADLSLYFPDYRSNEKTFQLITQVAGRAGREKKQGRVIMQTYNPHHYVFRFAKIYDYYGFYDKESNVRELTNFPPYSVIIRILITSEDKQKALTATRQGYDKIRHLKSQNNDIIIRAQAMKAPIKRMMNKYRFQIVVWIDLQKENEVLSKIYSEIRKIENRNVSCFIEINPTQMM